MRHGLRPLLAGFAVVEPEQSGAIETRLPSLWSEGEYGVLYRVRRGASTERSGR